MSEIRRTTTIEEIDVEPREPLISLSEVLAGGGWLAFQGLKLAATTAVVGTKLAVRGGIALSNAIREQRRHATFSEIDGIAKSSSSAREAVTSLAAFSTLQVPSRGANALSVKLQALVAKNDRAGVAAVAKELMAARQDRLQAQLIPLIAESCRAIGFTPERIDAARGLIKVKGQGRQSAVIEVAKAKDGGVQLHADTDGFEGGACIECFHEPFTREVKARGVQYELEERRTKQPRPVVDVRRTGHRIHVRSAN
ncbi:MAG: hypothetical protein WCH98_00530 [Verrucomicrobiota bacterium]